MRTVIGAIVVAFAGAAAQPAVAGTGAAADAGAPLPTVGVSAAISLPSRLLTMMTPLTASTVQASTAAFRLAPIAMPAVAVATRLVTTDLRAGLHRRFAGALTEFYPFAGSGFHLSGGTRLFARRNFIAETENSAGGALATTRTGMTSAVVRSGFRRFNPVLTAGYTMPLTAMAQIGVEAGAMAGRAYTGTPGVPRGAAGYRSDNAFHPDAIANLVFGMRF